MRIREYGFDQDPKTFLLPVKREPRWDYPPMIGNTDMGTGMIYKENGLKANNHTLPARAKVLNRHKGIQLSDNALREFVIIFKILHEISNIIIKKRIQWYY